MRILEKKTKQYLSVQVSSP